MMGIACVKKERPADFDPYLSNGEARDRWGAGVHTLLRWRSEMGVDRRKQSKWTDDEKRFLYENAESRTWKRLASDLGRSESSVQEMARRLGISRQHASGKGRRGFISESAPRYFMESARVIGLADMAADFLRCHDATCLYRCDESGKQDRDGKYWKYGHRSLVLTEDEMIAKATRKGWSYKV